MENFYIWQIGSSKELIDMQEFQHAQEEGRKRFEPSCAAAYRSSVI